VRNRIPKQRPYAPVSDDRAQRSALFCLLLIERKGVPPHTLLTKRVGTEPLAVCASVPFTDRWTEKRVETYCLFTKALGTVLDTKCVKAALDKTTGYEQPKMCREKLNLLFTQLLGTALPTRCLKVSASG